MCLHWVENQKLQFALTMLTCRVNSTIAFSAVRLTSLNSIDFEDFSYTVIPVMTWTTAEAGVAILVASSALLRPVFDKMFHRILSLSSEKTPGPSDHSAPYMGSQSRMNGKQRREFVNVGDVSSHRAMRLNHSVDTPSPLKTPPQ